MVEKVGWTRLLVLVFVRFRLTCSGSTLIRRQVFVNWCFTEKVLPEVSSRNIQILDTIVDVNYLGPQVVVALIHHVVLPTVAERDEVVVEFISVFSEDTIEDF